MKGTDKAEPGHVYTWSNGVLWIAVEVEAEGEDMTILELEDGVARVLTVFKDVCKYYPVRRIA